MIKFITGDEGPGPFYFIWQLDSETVIGVDSDGREYCEFDHVHTSPTRYCLVQNNKCTECGKKFPPFESIEMAVKLYLFKNPPKI